MFTKEIATFLSENSKGLLSFEDVLQSVVKVNVRTKLKNDQGDFSIPLRRFKDRCDAIVDLFTKFVIPETETIVTRISIWNCIMNIYVNKSHMIRNTLLNVFQAGDTYGKAVPNGKNVLIEFSSPNIAKPFHAGHLRSTILGQFLVNLYRFTGHSVTSMNYLGDWGKQFGILGYGMELQGVTIESLAKSSSPIETLNGIYVEMNALIKSEKKTFMEKLLIERPDIKDEEDAKQNGICIVSETDEAAKRFFTELEKGDPEKIKIWQYIRDASIAKYQTIYDNLGIHFDVYSGESEVRNGDESKEIVEQLSHHPNFVATDQRVHMDLRHNGGPGGLGTFILLKNDGSSLYSLRDLMAATDRFKKYNPDEMLYVVACEQEYYFKQLFTVLEMLNADNAGKCKHVSFGMVEGMSTRMGNVILLEAILETSKTHMKEKINANEEKAKRVVDIETTAEILGKSAVFIQDFKAERHKNYVFEWSRATDFEGQTGVYLQYSHVRLYNIIEKASAKGITLLGAGGGDQAGNDHGNGDGGPAVMLWSDEYFNQHLLEPDVQELVYMMTDWVNDANPDASVIGKCLKRCEAQPLVNWLFNFIKCVFTVYNNFSVVNCENQDTARARLLLFYCSKTIIANSLILLGLTPLCKM